MGRRDSGVYCKKFGVVNRYDLRKEFPALNTQKEPGSKAVRDELLVDLAEKIQ